MIDKSTIEALLMKLGSQLSKPTTLCVIGSTASIVVGQPSRQTPDIDVWFPRSSFDIGDLKRACEEVGLIYDPKGEVDPDAIYLQVVRPGMVSLPPAFEHEVLGHYGNLTLVMPPPALIVAAKLVRASDTDIEDAAWWVRGRDLTEEQIVAAIESIPSLNNREAARENLVLIQLMSSNYDGGGHDGPV
jgi:hypothetical protein